MPGRYISLVISTVLLFVNSCCKNDEKFDHPLDPGSTTYIPPTQGLIIDDYNDMERITAPIYQNPWGLEPFIFPETPPGDTAVVVSYTFECNHSVALRWHGCSLRIKFDVRRPAPQDFGGWGQRLGDSLGYFDATVANLTYVSFWFKGAKGGEVFEIGLHDAANFESDKYNITRDFQVTTEWQKAKIPLDSLINGSNPQGVRGKVNLKALENVNIGFNRTLRNLQTRETSPQTGTIYIDDLAFER